MSEFSCSAVVHRVQLRFCYKAMDLYAKHASRYTVEHTWRRTRTMEVRTLFCYTLPVLATRQAICVWELLLVRTRKVFVNSRPTHSLIHDSYLACRALSCLTSSHFNLAFPHLKFSNVQCIDFVHCVLQIIITLCNQRVMMICNRQWTKSIQLVIDLGWRSAEQWLKCNALDERNSKRRLH